MTTKKIKEKLLLNGVKNLKEFGYTMVDTENILTDMVYSQFFSSMLNDNFGFDKDIDKAITELQTEIKQPK